MSNRSWESSDAKSPIEKAHVYVMKCVLASQLVRYLASRHEDRFSLGVSVRASSMTKRCAIRTEASASGGSLS